LHIRCRQLFDSNHHKKQLGIAKRAVEHEAMNQKPFKKFNAQEKLLLYEPNTKTAASLHKVQT
jgi:hypothetical protein